MQKRDIVVIGASAGGLIPLMELVRGLPATLDASIFIVQHFPPSLHSSLPSFLSSMGTLKATEAFDGEFICKRRIYVGPSDRQLLLELNTIVLEQTISRNRFRPTINALFCSAADTFGLRVIGIILSGMMDDGTHGLSEIKNAGGISVVQKPSDAQFKSMPENALKDHGADYILPAGAMGTLLGTLV